MVLLRLLSEELFDFSADQMTQAKARELKLQLSNELSQVFQLCLEVLKEAGKASLLKATLETLSRFVSWMPRMCFFPWYNEKAIKDGIQLGISLRQSYCSYLLIGYGLEFLLSIPSFLTHVT